LSAPTHLTQRDVYVTVFVWQTKDRTLPPLSEALQITRRTLPCQVSTGRDATSVAELKRVSANIACPCFPPLLLSRYQLEHTASVKFRDLTLFLLDRLPDLTHPVYLLTYRSSPCHPWAHPSPDPLRIPLQCFPYQVIIWFPQSMSDPPLFPCSDQHFNWLFGPVP
jgi:hypothetical protein